MYTEANALPTVDTIAGNLVEACATLNDIDSSLCVILNLPTGAESEATTVTELAERIRDRAAYIRTSVQSIRDRLGVSL